MINILLLTIFINFQAQYLMRDFKKWKLATSTDLADAEQHAVENKKKIEKLETYDLSFFIDKSYFSDDGHNFFSYFNWFSAPSQC